MEELLLSVYPDLCFWYAHPYKEQAKGSNRVGEFFGKDPSRLLHLSPASALEVRVRSLAMILLETSMAGAKLGHPMACLVGHAIQVRTLDNTAA